MFEVCVRVRARVPLSQGLELMLLSLADPSERVVSATHQVFIPAFAAWTTELGILHTTLIPSLLTRIERLLLVGGAVCVCVCVCVCFSHDPP